jgi:hypothetical protein
LSLSAARRRRRCGNVGTRVWCGFPSSVGRATIFGQDSAIGPTERHFYSELGILPILVRILSLATAQDQSVRFQKPAHSEHFYRLSCRANKQNSISERKMDKTDKITHRFPARCRSCSSAATTGSATEAVHWGDPSLLRRKQLASRRYGLGDLWGLQLGQAAAGPVRASRGRHLKLTRRETVGQLFPFFIPGLLQHLPVAGELFLGDRRCRFPA